MYVSNHSSNVRYYEEQSREPSLLLYQKWKLRENLRVTTSPHCCLQMVALITLCQKLLHHDTQSSLPQHWGDLTSSSHSL